MPIVRAWPLRIALLTLAATVMGCAPLPPRACAGGALPWVQDMLYFGAARPAGGTVTPEAWAQFLASTVTPRFPDGLTVWEASGQWRGKDGTIVREPSRVLSLLHLDDAAADLRVQEIVDAYVERFEQDAVLRVRAEVCAAT